MKEMIYKRKLREFFTKGHLQYLRKQGFVKLKAEMTLEDVLDFYPGTIQRIYTAEGNNKFFAVLNAIEMESGEMVLKFGTGGYGATIEEAVYNALLKIKF